MWINLIMPLRLNELFFLLKDYKLVHQWERNQSYAAKWLSIVGKEVKMMMNTGFDRRRNKNMIYESVQMYNTSMLDGFCDFFFLLFNKAAAIHSWR